jgi:hypothetical protein
MNQRAGELVAGAGAGAASGRCHAFDHGLKGGRVRGE